MRIVYILKEMNKESSTSNVTFNVLLNLNEDIEVIALGPSQTNNYKNDLDKKGIKYTEFDSLADSFINIQTILEIVENCDILHLHKYESHVLGDIIKRIKPEIKMVSVCYSYETDETKLHNNKGDQKVGALVRLREKRNFYQKHDRVIAVSKYVQEYLESIECYNNRVIHNSIDYDSLVQTTKEPTDVLQLCQVGIMFELKNQIYSIHLIKYLKEKGLNIKLHLIGDPNIDKEYVDNLKEFIKLNRLDDNVILHGYLETSELHKILSSVNIYMMPSLVDGLPLALLEAFYFELPAIVSQYGGMKEVMTGDNGLVVNVDDEKDFEKIYQYCHSKQYLQDGKKAKEIALKRYDSKIISTKFLDVYKELLDPNNIFNKLNRKKIYLFPKNNKMEDFEHQLFKNRIYIHGYIDSNLDNPSKSIDYKGYDYIVIDSNISHNKVLAYFDENKIISI